MKIRLALGAAAAAGLVVAGLWLSSKGDVAGPAAGVAAARYHWLPGAEQRYRLSIVSNVRLQLPGSTMFRTVTQRLSGTLEMRVFEWEDGLAQIGFQLSSASYTLNGQPDETLQRELEAPFVAVFDPHGRPLSFRFPEVLQKTERILLEESIRTFQAVFPEENRASWTTEEQHATGRYLAHYEIREDGNIQKRKTLYTEVNMPSGADDVSESPKADLRQSVAVIRLSPETAWVHGATVRETVSLSGGGGLSSEAAIRAELERILGAPKQEESALFAVENREELFRSSSRGPPPTVAGGGTEEPPTETHDPRSFERFTELLDQLNTVDKAGRIALLKRMEEALEANPDLAYLLIEQLQKPSNTEATDAWLIHLLERSGAPQAQEALVMVMDDPSYRDWNRIRAIVALGGVENATEEAVFSLFNVTRNRHGEDPVDLANAALVALGSIGKSLGKSDPYRADRIRQELSTTLQSAGDSTEEGMVLKAMENMGDPALKEVIRPYLEDDAPFVRGAAASALGRTRGEGALELLINRLTVEPDRQVRASIVTAMEGVGNATTRSVGSVRGLVLQETEAGTRYHMAKYLGDNLDDYPENRRMLQILALKDPSSRVRKHAAAVLLKALKQ